MINEETPEFIVEQINNVIDEHSIKEYEDSPDKPIIARPFRIEITI